MHYTGYLPSDKLLKPFFLKKSITREDLSKYADTQEELDSQTSVIFDQLDNNSKYTYNEEEDTYYYKNGDAEFSLTLKTSNGFMSMDGLFNRAIMMEIVNLREYNPEA